jgi:Nif-specific regulatory protein
MFGDLPFVSDHTIALKDRLALIEREMIHAEIRRNNGNKSKAAKEMGISREALRKKLLMSTDILKSLNLSEEERIRFQKEDDEFASAA